MGVGRYVAGMAAVPVERAASPPDARLALGAAVASQLLWSVGNVVAKAVDLPGAQLAAYRLALGALLMYVVLRVGRRRFRLASIRPALVAGVAFGVDMVVFFTAIKHTTVANATVITALQPVMLLLVAGRVFGERVSVRLVALISVCFAGVTVVVLGSAASPEWSPFGDALALVATALWAWYFVAAKQARQELGAVEFQVALQLVALVVVTPLALLVDGGLSMSHTDHLSGVLLMAAIPGTGHLLMNWAHPALPITTTSTLTLAMPVASSALAAVFLDEGLAPTQLVGMGVVLVALAMLVRHQQDLAET